jgi:methionyl-tRNA formyltransferase
MGEPARDVGAPALAPMGLRLLAQVIRHVEDTGALPARPQDEQFATRAPRLDG